MSNYNEIKYHSENHLDNTIFNSNLGNESTTNVSNRINNCTFTSTSSTNEHSRIEYKHDTTDSLFIDNSNPNTNINANIYRYKFTQNFTEDLYEFSKIHQYDHRKDFKEAWQQWIKDSDNEEKIQVERERLLRLDFNGDIINKMYKSARYYFRKKPTEKKEQQKRISYICISKDILDKMDLHLNQHMNNDNFKPKQAFLDFSENNQHLLESCINQICKDGITDLQQIKDKIKKTYKNRYFRIISKINK